MSTAHRADVPLATPDPIAPASLVADPMLPAIERVARVRREGADIWTLEIEPAAGFDFLPGQFNMLYALGVGEAAISISGDPADRGRLIHTIRAVGRVSEGVFVQSSGDQHQIEQKQHHDDRPAHMAVDHKTDQQSAAGQE